MGWPRKNEKMRIYRDKGNNGYFIILLDDYQRGNYGAVVNVYSGPEPSLVYGSVSSTYIYHNWPKRMQWDELPEEYKDAFTRYLNSGVDDGDPPFDPAKVRGLWRVGQQPPLPAQPEPDMPLIDYIEQKS